MSKINVLIPMAGLGKRFSDAGYNVPKPFIQVGGKPMIEAVISNLYQEGMHFIFCVAKEHVESYAITNLFEDIAEDFGFTYDVVEVESLTQGAASTCLLAKNLINSNDPLIITNCDQIIEDWDFETFEMFCDINSPDGVVGVFDSQSPKNSYIKIDSRGWGVELREKQVISNLASNGLHWWKRGKDFVASAEEMILMEDRTNNEFYVAPTYNYMIKKGAKIIVFKFEKHFPIGTPEDLEFYKKRISDV